MGLTARQPDDAGSQPHDAAYQLHDAGSQQAMPDVSYMTPEVGQMMPEVMRMPRAMVDGPSCGGGGSAAVTCDVIVVVFASFIHTHTHTHEPSRCASTCRRCCCCCCCCRTKRANEWRSTSPNARRARAARAPVSAHHVTRAAQRSRKRGQHRGVVERGRGGTAEGRRPPTFFDRGDASPTPPLFALKFVQKLVHCCNWLLTEDPLWQLF